jgi:hypothetical protein
MGLSEQLSIRRRSIHACRQCRDDYIDGDLFNMHVDNVGGILNNDDIIRSCNLISLLYFYGMGEFSSCMQHEQRSEDINSVTFTYVPGGSAA